MTALLVARPLFPSESAATYGDGLTMVMLWIALAAVLAAGGDRPTEVLDPLRLDRRRRAGCLIGWHSRGRALGRRGTARRGRRSTCSGNGWAWALCFLLARQLIATPREARAVAAVMIALAVALSGYGLYQYAYEMPQTRAEYEANPDRAMREAGLVVSARLARAATVRQLDCRAPSRWPPLL